MSEQCCLGDEAHSRLLWVLSLTRTRETNQDHPYPSQKRKLRLREVVGISKDTQVVLSGARTGRAFLVMVKPVISGHTETGNERSQDLGRWNVRG